MHRVTQYAGFVEHLAEQRRDAAETAPPLLRQIGEALPPNAAGLLQQTARLLSDTLSSLADAESELQARHDDLLAAQLGLEAQRQLYRELFEYAPLPYLLSDAHGVIRHVNWAVTSLLGRPVNALVGKPLAAYVALEERGAFRAGLARAMAGDAVEEWPVRLDCRAGRVPPCPPRAAQALPICRGAHLAARSRRSSLQGPAQWRRLV